MAVLVIEVEVRPALDVVEALARLLLAAKRQDGTVYVRNACTELRQLLDLVGLTLEARGEPEVGKQLGLEEVVLRRDAAP
jgi:hypothetical protein